MLCPKCGAYSPYNTPVCNRCGTSLLGKKAGKSPRHSHSERYYRRVRKSDWEKKRDDLAAKANDFLDSIMSDSDKRLKLLIAAGGAALAIVLSVGGCIACTCVGCGEEEPTTVSSSSASDSPFGAGSLFGEEEPASAADASASDATASESDTGSGSPFGAGSLFGE